MRSEDDKQLNASRDDAQSCSFIARPPGENAWFPQSGLAVADSGEDVSHARDDVPDQHVALRHVRLGYHLLLPAGGNSGATRREVISPEALDQLGRGGSAVCRRFFLNSGSTCSRLISEAQHASNALPPKLDTAAALQANYPGAAPCVFTCNM
jgi:hypothetical protein